MDRLVRSLSCLLVAGTAVSRTPASLAGQVPRQHSEARRAWHTSGTLRVDQQSNNNVYLLSETMRVRLDTTTTPAAPTTRFADMRSADDYIMSVRVGLAVEGAGLWGRTLSIRSDADYDWYSHNAKRRSIDLGLSIAQAFPLRGRLQLRGEILPSCFYHNFLADGVDRNADGAIQSSERLYAAGTYRDTRLLVGYRQRLIGSTRTHLSLELEGGRAERAYAAPLGYRGYRGPAVAATLALESTRPLKFDVTYTCAVLNSTPGTAVLVLDELDFNHDFNGNGTTTDFNVRSTELVNFSRLEQDVDADLGVDLSAIEGMRLHFEHRWRSYPSTQPYDVYNDSRRDHRELVGAELSLRVLPRLQFVVGGDYEIQRVKQSLVPALTDDITDYAHQRLYAGWQFRV